jgi:hypothetical protein
MMEMTANPLTTSLISPSCAFAPALESITTDTDAAAPDRATTIYFLSAFTIGQAIQINDGMLHPAGLGWLGLTLVILASALRPQDRLLPRVAKLSPTVIVAVALAIQWGEQLFWGIRWSERTVGSIGWFIAAMGIAGLGAAIIVRFARRAPLGLAILILGHLLASYYVIGSQPQPRIDVWHIQQTGATALLHGENPYENIYRNIYDPDTSFYGPGMCKDGWLTCGFPYPPLSIIAALPGRIVGDVRWSHVAFMELAAIVLALCLPRPHGIWSAAMLLLMPRSLLIVKFGWTEPLVVLLFVATLYCAIRAPKWLWLALGLLLASKQYTVLMIPLVVAHLLRGSSWREIARLLLKSAAVALVVTLPMALWDWHAFVNSVIMTHLHQPFRMEALSFTAMLARMTGVQIGAGLGFLIAIAAMFWTARQAPRTPAGFAAATALVFGLFFAFNKQAACNYYFLVFAACVCAAASIQLDALRGIAGEIDR